MIHDMYNIIIISTVNIWPVNRGFLNSLELPAILQSHKRSGASLRKSYLSASDNITDICWMTAVAVADKYRNTVYILYIALTVSRITRGRYVDT